MSNSDRKDVYLRVEEGWAGSFETRRPHLLHIGVSSTNRWMLQEPKLCAQYYDDRLRQEMRRLTGLAATKSAVPAQQFQILRPPSQKHENESTYRSLDSVRALVFAHRCLLHVLQHTNARSLVVCFCLSGCKQPRPGGKGHHCSRQQINAIAKPSVQSVLHHLAGQREKANPRPQ